MNKFILDFDKLKENDLYLEDYITLIGIFDEKINFVSDYNINGEYVQYKRLQDNSFIKILLNDKGYEFVIREKGKQFIKSCIYKEHQIELDNKLHSFVEKYLNNNFDTFIKEYRDLWKGLKVGSQGNAKSCSEKMQRWMKENPDYSQDDIIKAAKTYINSLDDLKYLQKADYFIYKKDKNGESSRLSDFIEEDEVKEQGWSSTLK